MVNSLENIDKSKVSAQRIEGLDDAVSSALGNVLTGAVSTITTNDLTANRALISNTNGKVAVSSRTSGQLEGITGYYGTCSTANSTQTKDVVCANFVLETGASIRVKFTNNQNYNGVPKLNVNGTGAKEIKSIGTTNAARYYWQAGEIRSFTYDGTYWLMDNGGIASTTYYGRTKLQTSATSTSEVLALTPKTLNSLVQNMIEPYAVYSSSSTYAVGDRVRYNYQAWECNTAISTAESWTAAHWTALPTIQEQIDALPSGGGSSRNVGEIVTSTIPLTDAGLHLLDGGVIQGGGAYDDFVTFIAGLVSSHSELFTTEANWQAAVTANGVCDKFVYTSGSPATVRLPKFGNQIYTSEFPNNVPVYGNGKTLGMTDGTNNFGVVGQVLTDAKLNGFTGGYDKNVGATGLNTGTTITAGVGYGVVTSGESGLIADMSDINTSLDVYYYIVVANSTKTEIEVDIDEVMTDLNGKVDTANLAPVHVIVETYQNGADWYRIYDDGWVEQGGESPNKTYTTINLLKPFRDTNYYFNASTLTTSYTSNASANAYARIISASQVGICGYNDANWIPPRWEAKGYGE